MIQYYLVYDTVMSGVRYSDMKKGRRSAMAVAAAAVLEQAVFGAGGSGAGQTLADLTKYVMGTGLYERVMSGV